MNCTGSRSYRSYRSYRLYRSYRSGIQRARNIYINEWEVDDLSVRGVQTLELNADLVQGVVIMSITRWRNHTRQPSTLNAELARDVQHVRPRNKKGRKKKKKPVAIERRARGETARRNTAGMQHVQQPKQRDMATVEIGRRARTRRITHRQRHRRHDTHRN